MLRQVGEWEAVRMESGEGSLHGLMGDCGNRPSVSVVRVHTHMRVTKTQSTSSDISSPSFVEQYCWIAISTALTLYQVSRETYRRFANSVTYRSKGFEHSHILVSVWGSGTISTGKAGLSCWVSVSAYLYEDSAILPKHMALPLCFHNWWSVKQSDPSKTLSESEYMWMPHSRQMPCLR